MLDAFQFVQHENLRSFLMLTQTKMGGFGKDDKAYPGIYIHTYIYIIKKSIY